MDILILESLNRGAPNKWKTSYEPQVIGEPIELPVYGWILESLLYREWAMVFVAIQQNNRYFVMVKDAKRAHASSDGKLSMQLHLQH